MKQGGAAKNLPCRGLRCESAPGGTLVCAGGTIIEFIPAAAFSSQEERDRFVWEIVEAASRPEAEDVRQEDEISVSFTWEREEFSEAVVEGNWLLISTREFWTVGRILLTVLTGAFGALSLFRSVESLFYTGGMSGTPLTLAIGIVVLILPNIRLIAGLPFFSRASLRGQIKNGVVSPDNFARQSCTISERGISSYTATGRKSYLWPQVTRCACRKGALILVVEDKWIYPIPESAFQSDEQRKRAEAQIHNNIS